MFGKNSSKGTNPLQAIEEQIKRNEEMIKTLQGVNDRLRKQKESLLNQKRINDKN